MLNARMKHSEEYFKAFHNQAVKTESTWVWNRYKIDRKSTVRGTGSSLIVDGICVTTTFAGRIFWFVIKRYTHDDHQAILLQTESGPRSEEHSRDGGASERVAQMMRNMMKACDAAMQRILANRQSNYWWNKEIEDLRVAYFRVRRV